MHEDAPSAEYCPVLQLMQVVDEVALTVLEYFPAGQEIHVADATVLEYLPGGQSMQSVTPAGEYVPIGQSIGAIEGFAQLFPAGHIMLPASPPNE